MALNMLFRFSKNKNISIKKRHALCKQHRKNPLKPYVFALTIRTPFKFSVQLAKIPHTYSNHLFLCKRVNFV